jgi:WD40-like Beta Propeller Repeat
VLTADCREVQGEDLYLRDNQTGRVRCLDPAVEDGPEPPCLVYGGMSEGDGSVFVAGKPEDGERYTYNLYQLTTGGEFHLISVLPNGEAASPTGGTSFGPGGSSFAGEENCQFTRTVLRHAVSQDGTKVFWTYVPEISAHEPSRLLVRIDGDKTRQLDAVQSGGGKAGSGVFRAASADGSVAYFTDAERLISGARAKTSPAEPDLYRYNVGSAKPLTDVTKGEVPGDVKGVVGASDDGSYVYFVAGAVLWGEGVKSLAGEAPVAGEDNLYVDHEGQVHFIAVLSEQDSGDWSAEPRQLSARVSPDGRHLAFLSTEAQALAGYENTIAAGEHCQYLLTTEKNLSLVGGPQCPEAFIYDTESEKLTCASCDPSGSRPLGPTVLPGWVNGFEGPRYLSDDGRRLFFESLDALLPADKNNKMDVYEFEMAGEGNCTSQSPTFDPASGGCHSLISSGKSEDESYLIDASSDGRDVFFSTREQLVGWDANANFDIYDARVGGGFPALPPVPRVCEGEECHGAPVVAPMLGLPASLSFIGPGDLFSPPPPPPPQSSPKPKATVRTRVRDLTKALKACRAKHNKHKLVVCERRARKHYAPPVSHSKHKSSKGGK